VVKGMSQTNFCTQVVARNGRIPYNIWLSSQKWSIFQIILGLF